MLHYLPLDVFTPLSASLPVQGTNINFCQGCSACCNIPVYIEGVIVFVSVLSTDVALKKDTKVHRPGIRVVHD